MGFDNGCEVCRVFIYTLSGKYKILDKKEVSGTYFEPDTFWLSFL